MIPVNTLTKKLNIKTTQLYEHLKVTEITPKKQGKTSYIADEELNTLLDLKKHLAAGGTLNNYIKPTQVHLDTLEPSLIHDPSVPLQSIIEFAKILIKQPQPDPIEKLQRKFDFLNFATESQIQLTTKEVKTLIGSKPHGTEFKRGSYTFIKTGKIGNQSSWTIEQN